MLDRAGHFVTNVFGQGGNGKRSGFSKRLKPRFDFCSPRQALPSSATKAHPEIYLVAMAFATPLRRVFDSFRPLIGGGSQMERRDSLMEIRRGLTFDDVPCCKPPGVRYHFPRQARSKRRLTDGISYECCRLISAAMDYVTEAPLDHRHAQTRGIGCGAPKPENRRKQPKKSAASNATKRYGRFNPVTICARCGHGRELAP